MYIAMVNGNVSVVLFSFFRLALLDNITDVFLITSGYAVWADINLVHDCLENRVASSVSVIQAIQYFFINEN